MKDINYLKTQGVDIDNSLEIFGDIKTYNETLGEFLHGLSEKLNKLDLYKSNGDMSNYAIYAHSLKNDAKYFGFTNLANVAYEHELKSKENEYYFIEEKFDKLKDEIAKTKKIVETYMQEDSSGEDETPAIDETLIFDKETILVVDDSNIVRNFVKRIFSDKYEVATANDGDEALNIIKANEENNNIISILLDLNMPKANGFKVLDYMKEHNLLEKEPVSIISGDSSKETIDRAFTYGIVDMLEKPFTQEDIKRVVEKNIYYRNINNNEE